MSLLLSIDTAGTVCAAAVSESGSVKTKRVLDEPRVHAAKLVPMIRDLVSEAGRTMEDLRGVAVSKGPGSYTGLRIGVSTAKGICFGLNVPLIGIETFRAMASANLDGEAGRSGLLVTVLPSRRGEAYWQLWLTDGPSLEPTSPPGSDEFEDISTTLREMEREIRMVGEAPEKLIQALETSGVTATLITGPGARPTIDGIVTLGTLALERAEFDDVANFEPYYLKEFVAKKGASPFDRLPF